jgi:RluA family pseudouridine synthase
MKRPLFSIIFENDALIAVNKASGLSVGGDRWDKSEERLDRLIGEHLAGAGEAPPGKKVLVVHRIDRDTSGLVIFAKNPEAHRLLSGAFEGGLVKKRYLAVVHGRPAWEETSCDLALVPDGDKKHRTIVDKYRGKKSHTAFRVLGGAGNYCVIEARPATGRTHQIRVHLAALGHPVVCDPLYGRASPKGVLLSAIKPSWRGDRLDEKPLLDRLGLHACELALPPLDQALFPESLCLSAPLPKDLGALLFQIEKINPTGMLTGKLA